MDRLTHTPALKASGIYILRMVSLRTLHLGPISKGVSNYICGISSMLTFLLMGLLPIVHPMGDKKFGILNWGLFGSVGALIAVFRDFRNSNFVELGNTDATKEVLRAFIGATLGFVAGVVSYSLVGGMVFVGKIFPVIDDTSLSNIALSILVGLASGYSFERIFDRVSTVSESGP